MVAFMVGIFVGVTIGVTNVMFSVGISHCIVGLTDADCVWFWMVILLQ